MTVLVVDDEVAITETLCVALELEGYSPIAAGNGREGLEQFDRASPHLVITDLMMPYVDGRELVRAIRARPGGRDVPIIVMSAAHDAIRDERIEHDRFVLKPFNLEELLGRVRELLAAKPART
jgi:two-component system phosphate regulon response regulator PhoB